MFGSKIEDNFEFEINWQKPYIINMECQKSVQPDLKDLVTLLTFSHVQM